MSSLPLAARNTFPKTEAEVKAHWAYLKIAQYQQKHLRNQGYPATLDLNVVFDEMARQAIFNIASHPLYKKYWLGNADAIQTFLEDNGETRLGRIWWKWA
jgi:hypothetical protein